MREIARNGCYKYTYAGVVFIYNPKTNTEVTSYKCKDEIQDEDISTGTRFSKPIILEKQKVDFKDVQSRKRTRDNLMKDKSLWTSHSVLVVDMSGSMRRDDVNGSRSRSDGVFMSIARDYVKIPLENGSRTSTDLISVVIMRDEAEILLACEPIDWFLFNKLIDLRSWENLRPFGHGNYKPALKLAQKLLNMNTLGTCALAILFFSDGSPSDYEENHKAIVGRLASKFGRRLSLTCIGMASERDNETFATLRSMAAEAGSYGSQACFGSASLSVDSLSKIVSSLASSLTTTKTELSEMTNMDTGKLMSIRTDIRREKIGKKDDLYLNKDWNVYEKQRYGRSWIWSYDHNDYVELFDFRCIVCNEDTRVNTEGTELKDSAILCQDCNSCCFCSLTCYHAGYNDHVLGNFNNIESCDAMKKLFIEKKIVRLPRPSYSLAVKKQIFGEGAERIVSKLRYLDNHQRFIGDIFVAKDSRFILDKTQYKKQAHFHRTFMRTQAISSVMADRFNKEIDKLQDRCSEAIWNKRVKKMPRIKFLQPVVTEVWSEQGQDALAEYFLIEPFLKGTYKKFNSNDGYVRNVKNHQSDDKSLDQSNENKKGVDLVDVMAQLQVSTGLDIIVEEDEEEDDYEEEAENIGSSMLETYQDIDDEHFPQAFSHFSYEKSRYNFIVVDLQGVLNEEMTGSKVYNLTDPVIHRRHRSTVLNFNYGRTNRSDKGIKAFISTHKCSDVCKLLDLKPLSNKKKKATNQENTAMKEIAPRDIDTRPRINPKQALSVQQDIEKNRTTKQWNTAMEEIAPRDTDTRPKANPKQVLSTQQNTTFKNVFDILNQEESSIEDLAPPQDARPKEVSQKPPPATFQSVFDILK